MFWVSQKVPPDAKWDRLLAGCCKGLQKLFSVCIHTHTHSRASLYGFRVFPQRECEALILASHHILLTTILRNPDIKLTNT